MIEPELNHPIKLTKAAARIAQKSTCYADLCWPDYDMVIEYQGKYDHTEDGAYDQDRARVNAFKEMGLDVLEITNEQVENLSVFEQLVMHIARKTGKVLDESKLGPTPQRATLRKELIAWKRNYGRRA